MTAQTLTAPTFTPPVPPAPPPARMSETTDADDADRFDDDFDEPDYEPPLDLPPPRRPPSSGVRSSTTSTGAKNPWLAGFLSFFPGIGHIYNGLYLRGLTMFLTIFGLIVLADKGHDFFGFAVAFAWIFNVLDSYRYANLINLGYARDLATVDLPTRRQLRGQGGVAAGVVLFAIGFFALLDRLVGFDFAWVVELWPLGFMVGGAWLVVSSVRAHKRRSTGYGL